MMWPGGGRAIHGLVRCGQNVTLLVKGGTPASATPQSIRFERPIRRRIATAISKCSTDKIQPSTLFLLSNGLFQRFPARMPFRRFHAGLVPYGYGPTRKLHTTVPTRPARAVMADTVKVRDATMYDKDAVLGIDSPLYEKGYDPLFSQYEEHLLAPYRHCYVAENQDRKVLGYCCASVVDEGSTLAFTPSRQFDPDLIPIFHDHLAKDLSHKSPNLTQIMGVFHVQDGRHEPEVTQLMRESGKEIMRRPVCRLELPLGGIMEQFQVLERMNTSRVTKIMPSRLWRFLDKPKKRKNLFPNEKMIICEEGYSVNKSNLDMLWGTKIRNVHVTVETKSSPHNAIAISVRNNYLVQNAMILHFIDIYANDDTEVLGHFVSQLHDSLRHPGRFDVGHVYKVHVPAETNVELFMEKCQEYLKTRIVNQAKQAVSLMAFEL